MIGKKKSYFEYFFIIPKSYKINYDCFTFYKIFNIKIYIKSNFNSIKLYYLSFLLTYLAINYGKFNITISLFSKTVISFIRIT